MSAALEDLFHLPVRFSIMASLVALDKAEFSLVREAIGVSDSVLSKQATVLETAGFLVVSKGHVGKRPRTWYSLTPAGRAAFAAHLQVLREIAEAAAAFTARGAP